LTQRLYAAFLNLQGKDCVVVGGGTVAERKVIALLECGAHIRVISPDLTPHLQRLVCDGQVTHVARRYRRGDVKQATVVIAATDSLDVNQAVADEADEHRIWVNVANLPERCTFVVPSVVRRGPLSIAITTSGMSPAVTKIVREELESQFGPEYELYLQKMGEVRKRLKSTVADENVRREVFRRIARSDVLALIREGNVVEADRRIAEIMRGQKLT
jgi:precorrin-2 dehydrogenase/sirohydrochlorin ferrochelatase